MRLASASLLIASAMTTLAACSAIVSPDPSRLGGVDAGPSSGVDTGPIGMIDTGPGAPDAFTPIGCTTPIECDDGDPCTIDQCSGGTCARTPRDGDADGHGDAACGGNDCNDASANVSPERPEQCGNGADDDCNPGTSDLCMTGLPDTCETAEVVDLSSGSAIVRGEFGALSPSYATYCIDEGRRAGRDAVYRIDLGARISDVRIETVGAVDTVLSIAGECGANFALPTCNDDARDGDSNARVWLHPTAGTIYVLVSAFDADAGAYEVHFTASAVTPNECGDGTLDVSAGGTVIGVPIPPSRVTGTCMPDGTSRALEAAVHLDTGNVDLELFAGFTAFLHARTSCDLRDEEMCEAGVDLGGGATYVDTNVRTDTRRLNVFVDGATRGDQGYALFVRP